MRLPFSIISCYYIVALILISCGDPPDVGGDIDSPVTTFNTASDTTFASSTVTLQWQGNETARIFDYQLQYNSISDTAITVISDAIDSTSITFHNLDEGDYTFIINGRYDIDNIESVKNLHFTVDAISGPALRIYPLSQTAQFGDSITVYLYFEDVPLDSAVTGLHVEIYIPLDSLEFISENYKNGKLIADFAGTTLWPSPSYNDSTMSIDGVADEDGVGLWGTGSIVEFHLKVLAIEGTLNISIGGNRTFLNIEGDIIDFEDPVSGKVMVVK